MNEGPRGNVEDEEAPDHGSRPWPLAVAPGRGPWPLAVAPGRGQGLWCVVMPPYSTTVTEFKHYRRFPASRSETALGTPPGLYIRTVKKNRSPNAILDIPWRSAAYKDELRGIPCNSRMDARDETVPS